MAQKWTLDIALNMSCIGKYVCSINIYFELSAIGRAELDSVQLCKTQV